MQIVIVGAGYVGSSLAELMAKNHDVKIVDINPDRATATPEIAYPYADVIFICVPTDYDYENNSFDTSQIEKVVAEISDLKSRAIICIKSTIPIGYTAKIQEQYKHLKILFSPEFLREGKSVYDNEHPSRIIVGDISNEARIIAELLLECSLDDYTPVLLVTSTESEAIKLFSNSYLACRVAFFNELDSFALKYHLDAKNIIKGVCLDERIGNHYNNPSFGYGGYCLPKDTLELTSSFKYIKSSLIKSICDSNTSRKDFIVEQILEKKPSTVGIYRLTMKNDSDNFRSSAIQGIMNRLYIKGIDCIIYEPELKSDNFVGIKKIDSLQEFKNQSDIIVANRYHKELSDVKEKVFTRDIFGRD